MLKENEETLRRMKEYQNNVLTNNVRCRGFGKTNMLINMMQLSIGYKVMESYVKESKVSITFDDVTKIVIEEIQKSYNE